MSDDRVLIRRVETQREYDECVRIEDEIWGAGFNERVPTTILRVSQYLGGVTAAAFDSADDRMLGFVFGITGVRNDRLVHWSDLLAVRPEARDRGLGRRLKLFQRSLVRPLGVTRMLWTFDPLVARNAHLNLNALGADVTEYIPDMYGLDTGSSLHSAVGTDRFVVAWDLTREPGLSRDGAATGHPPAHSVVVNAMEPDQAHARLRTSEEIREVYIAIPGDIQQVIATAPETARAWRESTREAFIWYLAHGHQVTGFYRAGDRGFYHLTRTPE
jgi:predicted GNAT superfamily acetyltransferase